MIEIGPNLTQILAGFGFLAAFAFAVWVAK